MPLKIEPSLTWSHATMRGSGAHGVCDDTRSISAITGVWCGWESSMRWNAERMYWSGMAA
jgi:hypothetical protein